MVVGNSGDDDSIACSNNKYNNNEEHRGNDDESRISRGILPPPRVGMILGQLKSVDILGD